MSAAMAVWTKGGDRRAGHDFTRMRDQTSPGPITSRPPASNRVWSMAFIAERRRLSEGRPSGATAWTGTAWPGIQRCAHARPSRNDRHIVLEQLDLQELQPGAFADHL